MNYRILLYYVPMILFITSLVFLMGTLPFYDNADGETQSILWNTFLALMFSTLLSFMIGVGSLLWESDGYDYYEPKPNPLVLNADDKISKEFPTFNEYWNSRR